MAVDPKSITDPRLLRNLMKNAEAKGRNDLVLECQIRIAELAGQEFDEVLEKEFWIAVAAAEEFASQKNGRTTRLSRTRQKEKRVGVVRCLTDWALDPNVTQGFLILMEGNRPDLTGEAIVVRHAERFSSEAVQSARAKLVKYGANPDDIKS